MTQPFRDLQTSFQQEIWPELVCSYKGDHLLLYSKQPLLTVSSALWRGGTEYATHFINGSVPLDYHCEAPEEMMSRQIIKWGYPVESSVGLLTAAKLTHAAFFAEIGDQFRILTCATAGTGNSARAGQMRPTFPAYQMGTINIFVMIDGNLTPSAMLNGLMTATEAKCAALQELQIADRYGGIATGTTSDAIVLAASQSELYSGQHAFAGTATTLGNAIGRLVYQSVYEAVSTQNEGMYEQRMDGW
ncbi:adenosylcobinamide amidohydrolase [Brevibacillus ginsengisoli]|uniref:adenosylcobinamide amidohydrolase n=1 Tax=Brevibacillus ginsengisoli TaxID=363854 RepID=UPI003CF926A4